MTGTRLAAACALALLLAAPAARADWKRDYGFGQQAYEKGDWAEAEAKMRAALAEEPAASARKRMQGTRFELYAPAHYAGLAAFRQGACGRALQYLDDGANRALVGQMPALAAEEQQVRNGCGGQVAAAPTPAPATPTAPAPTPSRPATPVATVPDKPAPAPVEAPKPAVRPPETVPVAPAPAATATRTAPPAALRTAVRAFIAGDYAAAMAVSDAGIGEARGRALVLLVRAAAAYTQAELRGGDSALRARAEQDVRAARKLARVDPDPNLFSPKVRALIAGVR